jgi:hypothetical protein
MDRKQYEEFVKQQNPEIHKKLGIDYEIVECRCVGTHQENCKGFITRFTDAYQDRWKNKDYQV